MGAPRPAAAATPPIGPARHRARRPGGRRLLGRNALEAEASSCRLPVCRQAPCAQPPLQASPTWQHPPASAKRPSLARPRPQAGRQLVHVANIGSCRPAWGAVRLGQLPARVGRCPPCGAPSATPQPASSLRPRAGRLLVHYCEMAAAAPPGARPALSGALGALAPCPAPLPRPAPAPGRAAPDALRHPQLLPRPGAGLPSGVRWRRPPLCQAPPLCQPRTLHSTHLMAGWAKSEQERRGAGQGEAGRGGGQLRGPRQAANPGAPGCARRAGPRQTPRAPAPTHPRQSGGSRGARPASWCGKERGGRGGGRWAGQQAPAPQAAQPKQRSRPAAFPCRTPPALPMTLPAPGPPTRPHL
jgi:hypothetical protein